MLCVLLLVLLKFVEGDVQMNDNMRSFSHAVKGQKCHVGEEIVLFEHVGPAVLTEQWYTGMKCMNEHTTVRYYIDGDKTPTIEANLFMMHAIGFYDSNTKPWGTKWLGHVANGGGLYNTYRMPYQKSIRISFVSTKTSGYYWYIVRGVENYPVIIGDMKLPANARLVLHKIEAKTIPPLAYVPLVSTKNRGIVFSVALAGDSANFRWLEGCFGVVVTNSNKTTVNLLSSGTEDMFLSAYYYNKGQFHNDDAGLTYFKYPGRMSAYKFFSQDPIIMSGSFSLLYRNSEVSYFGCWHDKEDMPPIRKAGYMEYLKHLKNVSNGNPLNPATITAYVWTYEW